MKSSSKLIFNYLLIILFFLFNYRRIVSTNDQQDNTLKSLLFKPVPQQTIAFNVAPFRRTKSSTTKKRYGSSQSIDSVESNGKYSFKEKKNEKSNRNIL